MRLFKDVLYTVEEEPEKVIIKLNYTTFIGGLIIVIISWFILIYLLSTVWGAALRGAIEVPVYGVLFILYCIGYYFEPYSIIKKAEEKGFIVTPSNWVFSDKIEIKKKE